MLTSYADESGYSSDPCCRFVGLGGLVAPSDGGWDKFEASWQKALDDFIPGHSFHMREYVVVPGIGPYEGWDERKRRAFMSRLIAAILESGARPVACVVSLDHFEMLRPEHQRAFRDPYYMALQEVTKGLSLSAMPKQVPFEPEKVAMVYAYQEEFGATDLGRVQQLWHLIQKEAAWGQWMGTYSSAMPKDVLPLQAADLFAYEITHEFELWLKKPGNGMRWPLKQIIKSQRDKSLLIKLFTFPVMIATLGESGATAPDEIFSLAARMDMRLSQDVLRERAEQ